LLADDELLTGSLAAPVSHKPFDDLELCVSKLIFRTTSLLAVCCFVLLVLLPVGTMAAAADKKSVAELYVTSW